MGAAVFIVAYVEQIESQTLSVDWASRIKMFVEQMSLEVTVELAEWVP